MPSVRIYELARELDVEPRLIMAELEQMGEFVRSASSTVGELAARRLRQVFPVNELPQSIRAAIQDRRLRDAALLMGALRRHHQETWDLLQAEIGSFLLSDADRVRAEWLTGLWLIAAGTAADLAPRTSDVAEPPRTRSQPQAEGDTSESQPPVKQRPEESGRVLEAGFLGLLETLFELSETERVRIRQQNSGTQFGHDIETDAVDRRTGLVRCHIECKNQTSQVGLDEIGPKLLQELVYWDGKKVDYFVVIAPRARISNELSLLAQICNETWKLPFQVLIWSRDERVDELFQLTPELHQELYGRGVPENDLERRAEIARRWAAKLQPIARVPDSVRRYLTEPTRHLLYGEGDFEAVRGDSITLGALTGAGAPIPGTLHDAVREWLTGQNEKTLLLLAEFGDGKSFFGYELGLRLAEEYLADPANGWACLRIPLRSLREDSQPSVMLERRLKEIGVSLAEWTALATNGRTLVILDGFDEMSAELDPQTLAANIAVLARCIAYFPSSKMMVSSRTHFFEHVADFENFLEVLGNPRLLRIAPIPLRTRLSHLEAYAVRIGKSATLDRLKTLNDPIGLAAKPLFLQMIKETLPDLPDDGSFDEIKLYEQYVRKSLKRKAADLQPPQPLGEERLISNLTDILESLAVQLHESPTDYVNLRDFDMGRREGLPELLWRMTGAASEEDARVRVGGRSLLKQVAGVNPEKWPVDFFHRSMREFFVARALVRAVDAQDATSILATVALQPEIVEFARLLMLRDDPETFALKLVSLARSAILPLYADKHVGGNALTLLYALKGDLPRRDWSELALDYADLSGADLSGMSFRGSSLRHASLDNTRLIETDLRDADLTGVQLERTGRIMAFTFDVDSHRVYAAYGHRSLRRWTLGVGGRRSCETIAKLDLEADSLDLTPSGDLMIGAGDSIVVYSASGTGETWRVVSRFKLHDAAANLRIRGNHVVITAAYLPDAEIRIIYDPVERRELDASKDWLLFEAAPGHTSMDTQDISDGRHLVVLGHEDGAVSLWHLLPEHPPQWKKIWERKVHSGSVSHVRVFGMFVLSGGGMDQTISLFTLADDWSTGEPLRLHHTLEYAGMKIDGVRDARAMEMLQSLALENHPVTFPGSDG